MARRALPPLALLVALGPLLLLIPGTGAAWTSGRLSSSAASSASARLSASHTWAGGSCSASGPADTVCAGSPLATGASSSTTQSVADTVANATTSTGGLGVAPSFTHQVQVVSCAPARFADTATPTDPLLPRYRVGRNVADPWGSTSAASFDGSTQYAADAVPTSTSAVAATSYSMGLWFRASPASSGGGLLSLNASPTASTSAGANPALFVDAGGRVRARLDGVPVLVLPVILSLVSPSGVDYRDGAWHQVTLTVNRKTLTSDVVLYVDGAVADTLTNTSLLVGTLSDSWWHVGWTDTTALLGSPAAYFTGRLSGVFRTPTVLSPAAVAGLASSASAAAYAAQLAGAQHLWMLGDAASATFASTLVYVGGNGLPCSQVRLSWTLGATAALALTPIDQLAGAGWAPASPAAAPGGGGSQTLTTGYARIAAGYDADVGGLELVVALAHQLQLAGSSWVLRVDWPAAVVLG